MEKINVETITKNPEFQKIIKNDNLSEVFFTLSEDTFKFLLSQDIDLDYRGVDMYRTPTVLKDSLSLGLTNKNLIVLESIEILNQKKNSKSLKFLLKKEDV